MELRRIYNAVSCKHTCSAFVDNIRDSSCTWRPPMLIWKQVLFCCTSGQNARGTFSLMGFFFTLHPKIQLQLFKLRLRKIISLSRFELTTFLKWVKRTAKFSSFFIKCIAVCHLYNEWLVELWEVLSPVLRLEGVTNTFFY